jgi:putative membrane protein
MFLGRWLVTTLAVWIAVELVPGLRYDRWQTLALASLVLGVLNTFVKPVLEFLTIPLIAVSFGLFVVVINAMMLRWTSHLVNGFTVEGWGPALLGGIIISIVSLLFGGRHLVRIYWG